LARYDFASDNVAGAMPEVMAALTEANSGFAAGYGDDQVSRQAADAIRAWLDADVAVRFVATGTFSNALSMAMLAQPHEAAIVHEHSHIATDETGAPGFFGSGVGLITLRGPSGRIDPQHLAEVLDRPDHAHAQGPAGFSLTQATEYGVVYPQADVGALIGQAKAAGLKTHLDGARLANAVAAGFDQRALAGMGLDVLSLGGTKAGSTPTEAIVLFDKTLEHRIGARLKHAGQLLSKGRFLSAPWLGLLGDGAPMVERARHANAMAQRLAAAMPFRITHPVEANGVFVEMDEPTLLRLRDAGWFVYRFIDGSVRFMCSWATTEGAVDELGESLRGIV
jgi:threonine aldolase